MALILFLKHQVVERRMRRLSSKWLNTSHLKCLLAKKKRKKKRKESSIDTGEKTRWHFQTTVWKMKHSLGGNPHLRCGNNCVFTIGLLKVLHFSLPAHAKTRQQCRESTRAPSISLRGHRVRRDMNRIGTSQCEDDYHSWLWDLLLSTSDSQWQLFNSDSRRVPSPNLARYHLELKCSDVDVTG